MGSGRGSWETLATKSALSSSVWRSRVTSRTTTTSASMSPSAATMGAWA